MIDGKKAQSRLISFCKKAATSTKESTARAALHIQSRLKKWGDRMWNPLWHRCVTIGILALIPIAVVALYLPKNDGSKRASEIAEEARFLCSELNRVTWGRVQEDNASIQVGELSVVGFLEIKSLELSLPVLNNTIGRMQEISVCRFDIEDSKEAIFQLSGTEASWQFGEIDQLKEEDRVVYTDIFGNVREYAVTAEKPDGEEKNLVLLQVDGKGEIKKMIYCFSIEG